jgi:hypothetical protein
VRESHLGIELVIPCELPGHVEELHNPVLYDYGLMFKRNQR